MHTECYPPVVSGDAASVFNHIAPRVLLLGGPNGAGKTTIAPHLLAEHLSIERYVNADRIAEGLDGFSPASVSLTAGRVMLERVHALAARRESFAFETTLASRTFADWIGRLQADGYVFLLFFVALQTSDIAVARVAERVRLGGHQVEEGDIRRRFIRGLRNFFGLYRPLADRWWFYDNSGPERAIEVARSQRGEGATTVVAAELWRYYKEVGDVPTP